jgi:hypothetical protein
MTGRWTVRKHNGAWGVYDWGVLSDKFDTLDEAHTWATQNAVADELYAPGGLTRIALIRDLLKPNTIWDIDLKAEA